MSKSWLLPATGFKRKGYLFLVAVEQLLCFYRWEEKVHLQWSEMANSVLVLSSSIKSQPDSKSVSLPPVL